MCDLSCIRCEVYLASSCVRVSSMHGRVRSFLSKAISEEVVFD